MFAKAMFTEAELSNIVTACETSDMRRDPAWRDGLDAIAARARELRDAPPASSDPRRVVVTYTSNSNSPRARRWYRIELACDFGEGPVLYSDFAASVDGNDWNRSTSDKNRAMLAAKAYAAGKGFTFLPGLWRGLAGRAMTREVCEGGLMK